MKITRFILLCILTSFWSCSDNSDIVVQPLGVTFNFSHAWNGTDVTRLDFNELKFVTENEDTLSIERLRYVLSEFTFRHESGVETVIEGYNLVDLTNEENLSFFTTETILPGNYTVTFRFGFSDAANQDGIYADLNVANFNVPTTLGGGYHYMQFDGSYLDSSSDEMPFNYHAIRAFDTTGTEDPQDTSFEVSLGSAEVLDGNTNINVQADLYQWFSTPNTWDLNVLNTMLMPNYDAQLLISQNGTNVFSLVDVTQE
jgi:hypothetical protein